MQTISNELIILSLSPHCLIVSRVLGQKDGPERENDGAPDPQLDLMLLIFSSLCTLTFGDHKIYCMDFNMVQLYDLNTKFIICFYHISH